MSNDYWGIFNMSGPINVTSICQHKPTKKFSIIIKQTQNQTSN